MHVMFNIGVVCCDVFVNFGHVQDLIKYTFTGFDSLLKLEDFIYYDTNQSHSNWNRF